jgi:hypothetical protein
LIEIPESFRTNGGAAIDQVAAVEGELSSF